MGNYPAGGGAKFRHHATRLVLFSAEDLAQLAAGATRTLIIGTDGFATLFLEVTCDTVLTITVYGGWTVDGPWTLLDTVTGSGDPADPDAIEVFCKHPVQKVTINNGTGGATTDLALYARLSTAVGVA